MTGRFAPSPTGDLHVGNLRTALASWFDARERGGAWLVRFEDLDGAVSDRATGARQLDSLAALGMDPDQEPLWQSDHLDRYREAIDALVTDDRTYPCFCTRREIREAASAPHGPPQGMYPGICTNLSTADRERRAGDRPAALRFRSAGAEVVFDDRNNGPQEFVVDDFVVRRNDGVPAYNLVVVVDDAAQGVTTVVRADDLLSSTARQILLAEALDLGRFTYAHVPLVVNRTGDRLTKRDGAMTLPQIAEFGWSAADLKAWILDSMGLGPNDPWSSRRHPSDWFNVWTPPG
ncbi:MAG: tRNA glutamyl-Q(34) synthetase GluQRS [Acidimicrobiales bacterium]|nr:tRNA glutamyl-Q(34) synthetase GluQRS [Acidimicrobiales bacterium]